ncbi:MAG: TlpA family protein disulfide reductase [Methylotenera sp.]|nr:TlpA family protein disulfide reductase [Methylotenera sp.]
MNITLKKSLLPIVITALLIFLGFQLNNKPSAPNVTFTTIDGKKIAMEDLKGKVVLVNFWATDCPGCIKEMPQLVNVYKKYNKKGFEIVAVAMPYDPPAQVLNYAKMKALPFPVMHDGLSEITNKFGGINLTPTTYIFDNQGKRLQRTIGELNFSKLSQLLNTELAK